MLLHLKKVVLLLLLSMAFFTAGHTSVYAAGDGNIDGGGGGMGKVRIRMSGEITWMVSVLPLLQQMARLLPPHLI